MWKGNFAQEQLKIAHRFGVAFDYATIGIVVMDEEGKIQNINPHAEQEFGYEKEELLGKEIEVLIPERFRKRHKAYRVKFAKDPQPRLMGKGRDLFAVKKDGSEFPVEVSLGPYYVENRLFVMAFIIDNTIRIQQKETVIRQHDKLEKAAAEIRLLNSELEKKIEGRTKILLQTLDELEKSKDELNEALRAEKEVGELKSRFVSMASHEFRTPLSTILSSVFLLEKYNDTDNKEARLKHIKRIRDSVAGLKSILDDFLILGKIEEGEIFDSKKELDEQEVRKVIEQVIDDMGFRLQKEQKIHLETIDAFRIHADVDILRNIMVNLLGNSIKFSKESRDIFVSCRTTEKEVILSVKDQGIGIAKEEQGYLTDRFFRAENAANIQGTGLGLYIVAQYLNMLEGELKVESELNKGSVFSIYIPRIG